MAPDVQWLEPKEAPEVGAPPPAEESYETELRNLRDDVRRLREQVAALAVRAAPEEGRLPTYIPALDHALQGGFPRGHVIGIVGPGGSMKTSLALSILVRNRAAGTRGIYVTMEETRDSILQTMRRLGLGDAEDFLVDVGRLRLEHAGAKEIRDWVRVLQDYLGRRQEKDPVGLIVIDSLDALGSLTKIEDARSEFFRFFHFLRSLGSTTIVIAEQDPARPGVDHDVAFLADGVLELRFSGVGEGRVQLLLRVAKMRHTDHSRDYYILSYGGNAFHARPYALPRRRWWRREG